MRRKLLRYALGVSIVFGAVSVSNITAYAEDLQDVIVEGELSRAENANAAEVIVEETEQSETEENNATDETKTSSSESEAVDLKLAESESSESEAVDLELAESESSESVPVDSEFTESEPVVSESTKTEDVETVDVLGGLVSGWECYGTDRKLWSYYMNGEKLCGGPYVINNKRYLFDESGTLITLKLCVGSDKVLYETNANGVATPVSTKNGWFRNYYYLTDGKVVTGWKKIGNDWYFFDERTGIMKTGLVQDESGEYYLDASGRMKIGWIAITTWGRTKWKWADSKGRIVQNGWRTIGGSDYYFVDGVMATYIHTIDGVYYNFGNNGKCIGKVTTRNNWVKSGDYWYFINADGTFANGLMEIGGKTYYFSNGVMCTNFDKGDYCIDAKGIVARNMWKETGIGRWSYYGDDCKRVIGWQKINNAWYYFSEKNGLAAYVYGEMVTGDWVIDGKRYHFDASGKWDGEPGIKVSSWYKKGNLWHYCKSDGTDATGFTEIGGDVYCFDYKGEMQYYTKQWHANELFVFGKNGKKIKSGWFKLDGNYDGYYVYVRDGKCVTGLQTIDNKQYYFNRYGEMLCSCNCVSPDQKYVYEINASGVIVKTYTASGTGWVKLSNGEYCYSKNGLFVKGCEEIIGGETYYFDTDGIMASDYYKTDVGYYGISGKLTKTNGWISFVNEYSGDTLWRYLINGSLVKEQARIINGKEYYFDYEGNVVNGVVLVDGAYYYYNGPSGGKTKVNFKEGWNLYKGEWYYMRSGRLVEGNLKINGKWYQFDWLYKMRKETSAPEHYVSPGSGGPCLGIYIEADGSLARNCWRKSFGKWYYYGVDGRSVVGEQIIDGKKYLFSTLGRFIE